MRIEGEKMIMFIEDNFDGNANKCALRLGVSPSTICRVVSGKSKPGLKLISQVIIYCNYKNLELEKYIILN
jgi:hypothetical protein